MFPSLRVGENKGFGKHKCPYSSCIAMLLLTQSNFWKVHGYIMNRPNLYKDWKAKKRWKKNSHQARRYKPTSFLADNRIKHCLFLSLKLLYSHSIFFLYEKPKFISTPCEFIESIVRWTATRQIRGKHCNEWKLRKVLTTRAITLQLHGFQGSNWEGQGSWKCREICEKSIYYSEKTTVYLSISGKRMNFDGLYSNSIVEPTVETIGEKERIIILRIRGRQKRSRS